MDQGTAPDSSQWSLRSRGPAHVVSHRCLDAQRAARPRSVADRVFGVDPLHPDAVPWYRSALVERRVGRLLAGLGDAWRVLHSVPHDTRDIDHLVIGPPGVVTVSTGGVVAAELEARTVLRVLARATGIAVTVTPIVVADAAPRPPHDMVAPLRPSTPLVELRRLVPHLRSLPATLEPDAIATIARAAEEWTTWRPFGVDERHHDPDVAFERLHTSVVGARRRRTAWAIAGILILTAPGFALASGLFL